MGNKPKIIQTEKFKKNGKNQYFNSSNLPYQ